MSEPTRTSNEASATMRTVAHHRYGPPEVLVPVELPRPTAGQGEVVLRVRAVAVGRAECAMRAADPPIARLAAGLLRPRQPVMGGDFAGEVISVGAGVTDLRPGDRVVAVSMRGGGYAEEVTVARSCVVAVPDGVSFADAVAVTEGGLTALPFVRDHGQVGQGTRLLVNGAAGAVGVMAVQLAAIRGAEVTAVCRAENAELVRSLGAARVVDRTVEDFTAARDRYDVVLDAVGTSSFRRAAAALVPGGHYLTTVPSAAILPQMAWTRLPGIRRLRGGRRATLATTGLRPVAAKVRDMEHLLDLTDRGELRAVVDRTYPLAEAVEANRYVDSGAKRGAVLLVP